MKTLLERVTGWLDHQQWKHGLPETYTQDYINALSKYELLEAISEALAEKEKEQ